MISKKKNVSLTEKIKMLELNLEKEKQKKYLVKNYQCKLNVEEGSFKRK